jgi:hypothetical protein
MSIIGTHKHSLVSGKLDYLYGREAISLHAIREYTEKRLSYTKYEFWCDLRG